MWCFWVGFFFFTLEDMFWRNA